MNSNLNFKKFKNHPLCSKGQLKKHPTTLKCNNIIWFIPWTFFQILAWKLNTKSWHWPFMIILGWNYTNWKMKFGMKEKVRLHAKIGWIRKNIYVYYKHKHFDHTSMGHIFLHVVTSNVFFFINYECIALFLKFSLDLLYF
jgi:hypothetical protein